MVQSGPDHEDQRHDKRDQFDSDKDIDSCPLIETIKDDCASPFMVGNHLIIVKIAKGAAGRKMSRLPESLAQGKTVPKIGINRIGDGGFCSYEDKEVKPEEKLSPSR